jgi:hypothetical protein
VSIAKIHPEAKALVQEELNPIGDKITYKRGLAITSVTL